MGEAAQVRGGEDAFVATVVGRRPYAFLTDPLGGRVVALEHHADAEHPQGPGAVRALCRADVQSALGVAAGLRQVTAAAPEEADAVGHLLGRGGVVDEQVVEGRAQVGVRVGDAVVPADLVVAGPARVGAAGQLQEAGGVLVGGGPFLAEFGQPHPAVLPDGVQHPVAHAVAHDDRFGHQPAQCRADHVPGEWSPGADLAGRGLVEVGTQHGQPGPEQPFQRGAQFVAPADGGAQGAVALRPDRRVGEQIEAGADPQRDLLDGVAAGARRREFDGERNAFQPTADLGGRRGGARCVEHGARGGRGGPVPEQGEGVGGAVDGQRLHLDELLALDAEGLPAGGEHRESG